MDIVVHVVVDYPRLREARGQLRDKVGDALGSIAALLGGRNGPGQVGNSRQELHTVLEFAEASQRLVSRAPAAGTSEQHRP